MASGKPPTPSGEPPHGRREREVIAYLAFMGILLAFGIDAALPAFDELRQAFALDPGSNQVSLVVTLYFVGMASGQLVYGPIADRFGRVPALLGGIGLYGLGAIGAMAARSIEWLLVCRLVWGLGAAAPGVLRSTVARDLYAGDQMARIMAIVMGVFMIGPVVAPVIGAAIVSVATWHWVFAAALVLAGVQAVWALRFGETLRADQRRELRPIEIVTGFRVVFSAPVTLRYTVALTFAFGAFVSFLGSSQPVIDRIYGRGDTFPLWFGLISITLALAFFTVNPFIARYGAHRVAVVSIVMTVVSAVVLAVAATGADGVPSFWVWLITMGTANAFVTLLTPTCYSLGLAPMGDRAGMASGVMGFASSAGGAGLAAIVDAATVPTVTPMALGYAVYGTIALAFLVWARAGAPVAERT
jgi:DHA1 family bicyclomycin/chloramphenicol resistance-like MFS transporter